MSDDYNADVFRTRAIAPAVAEERGYRRYDAERGLDPILEADRRYEDGPFKWADGSPGTLRAWVTRKTRGGKLPGWAMPKHALPGSAFDAPLAQLRPDDPVPGKPLTHSHADLSPGTLARHLANEERRHEHEALTDISSETHSHREVAKYLLPPGPHGKRWDTHPRCTPDRFMAAERVFLHMEGTLKLDALVSAGEVGADVPSVTLWDRRPGDVSELDFSVPRPSWPRGFRFGDYVEGSPYMEELDAFEALQSSELSSFLAGYVRSPVIVVCDRDWRTNPRVTLEAFSLRDVVRDAGLRCVVAAPGGRSKGSDDFQFRGGKPDNLRVVEPRPWMARGRVEFERMYRRLHAHAGASKRRRPSTTTDRELALLDWYVTHATVEGFVRMPVTRISRRLGVSTDTVRRDTLNLQSAGAIHIDGAYHDPDDPDDKWKPGDDPSRGHAPTATLRLRDDLIAARWEPTVGRWLATLG